MQPEKNKLYSYYTKNKKTFWKSLLFLGTVMYFLFYIIIFTQDKPIMPSMLLIPKLNIISNLEAVGQNEDGTMGTPKDINNTGWYKIGALPGDIGTVVLAGHSGWKNNIPAVFDDLYKLEIGDHVYIVKEDGVKVAFKVDKIKRYKPNADASSIFISDDGRSHLNLITCAGEWNAVEKNYEERLVVFTTRE